MSTHPKTEGHAIMALVGPDVPDRLADCVVEQMMAVLPEIIRRSRLGEYLTDKEAQAETGLSARQLRNLRDKRRIEYNRVGRAVLYRTESLLAAIDEGRIPVRETPRARQRRRAS